MCVAACLVHVARILVARVLIVHVLVAVVIIRVVQIVLCIGFLVFISVLVHDVVIC